MGESVRFTVEGVKKRAATDARQEIADFVQGGLYLIIQPSGAKSWAYRGKVNGENRKIKLGNFPAVDLTMARDRAAAARGEAHSGRDYVAPADTESHSPAAPGDSVADVWDLYRTLRLIPECRDTTVSEHTRIFEAHIKPKLGTRDIASIVKADLLPIADAALSRGFEARNKMVAVLTGFFGWAHEERDLIAKSPVIGIKQRTSKKKRKRTLDEAEIKAFWKGCNAIDADNLSTVRFGKMFQLLLLTGCRRNEVAGMSRTEIRGNRWTIPGERTKNGVPLVVHLTKAAIAILDDLPRLNSSDYVFGPTGETCGFGFSKAKKRLDEKAAAEIKAPWRLHDLRRTARTGWGQLGVREEVAERMLNHVPGALIGTYNQHPYMAEMAEGWTKWSDQVLATVNQSRRKRRSVVERQAEMA